MTVHSKGTASVKEEEGGDDVKSSWPLCPGLHTSYSGRYSGLRHREVELILKGGHGSDSRLQLACLKTESLVIADQNAAVNTFPGLVHTARHAMGVGNARSPSFAGAQGGADDWGEVVTR